MRTLLICHERAALDREGLVRWLGSFSSVSGVVVVRERHTRIRRRIAREMKRVGRWRFVDVVAFRLWYQLAHAAVDRKWEACALDELRARFPERSDAPEIVVRSPNAPEAARFIRDRAPDLVVARCKTLLKEEVFSIPPVGTFVMHPGICPEYRNAHGCFWARARGDYDNIGMTLLRIDRGIDTGPVYGYFRVSCDAAESHVVTQHRVVLEHLDAIRDRLLAVRDGSAAPVDTTGRQSAAWGQPWLSAYIRMRRRRPGVRRMNPQLKIET